MKVIVTVGPALINDSRKLQEIHAKGPCIFRINGAHANATTAKNFARLVREALPNADIMIDLPGNKIRTANLSEPLMFEEGKDFFLYDFQINYPGFVQLVKPGDLVYACDSCYTLEVHEAFADRIRFHPLCSGSIATNKGLHLKGSNASLPFLFERDKELIAVACAEKFAYISLSFVRNCRDIRTAHQEIANCGGYQPKVIAKIETASALENLDDILQVAERVNIDRGDLAADIDLLNVPTAVENVVAKALLAGREIFLATQFLKSMEENPVPLIAEVMDIHKSIRSGITGIQLSEETAVGRYPTSCVDIIFEIARRYR